MKQSYIDFPKLSKLLKARRDALGYGLRDAADAIEEISPSTLSRIEGERVQDLNVSTFLRLCDWLHVAPKDLIISEQHANDEPKLPVMESVELHLRAAKELDEQTALMLAKMVNAAYEAVKHDG